VVHLISMEKITYYRLLFKLKIIFHHGRKNVLDMGFVVSGTQ